MSVTNTALITGGRGFLGRHLSEALAAQGWRVHITSRSSESDTSSRIHQHVCDLAEIDAARRILNDVDPSVIFHLAGAVSASPDMNLVLPTFHSHVTSSINLMTCLTNYPDARLVLCGSLNEGAEESPSSPYGAAKTAVRIYSQMFNLLFDSRVVIVRPFMTFGPGQHGSKVLPYVIRSFAAGEAPKISSGQWRADWIYVSDVVDGFVRAATSPGIEGMELDLGRGELHSLQSMVERIGTAMGTSIAPQYGSMDDRPEEPERTANVGATKRHLDWMPKVSLDEGIARTIQSFVQRGESLP